MAAVYKPAQTSVNHGSSTHNTRFFCHIERCIGKPPIPYLAGAGLQHGNLRVGGRIKSGLPFIKRPGNYPVIDDEYCTDRDLAFFKCLFRLSDGTGHEVSVRSHEVHWSTPSPDLHESSNIFMDGFRDRASFFIFSTSTSRNGRRSILLIISAADSWNMSGYFNGLSCPSAILRIITFMSSPTWNSAGQTRLPTFSITRRSSLSSGRSGITSVIMLASRWQAPPVFICTRGTPRRFILTASSVPVISPSITPIFRSRFSPAMVASRSDVFPAPGELIRLITYTPESEKMRLFSRAIRSFASSIFEATFNFIINRPPILLCPAHDRNARYKRCCRIEDSRARIFQMM